MVALPQRNFSHYVHLIDLRKVQRPWDSSGQHYLHWTGELHWQISKEFLETLKKFSNPNRYFIGWLEGKKKQMTYKNNFNWNGKGQLMAIACTQLFHHYQNCSTDQGKKPARQSLHQEGHQQFPPVSAIKGIHIVSLQKLLLHDENQRQLTETYIDDCQRATARRHEACSSHETSDEGLWQMDGYEPELHEPQAHLQTRSMFNVDIASYRSHTFCFLK